MAVNRIIIFCMVAGMLPCAFSKAQPGGKPMRDSLPSKVSDIVFVVDISNSMSRDNKMILLKKSTGELLKLLTPRDRISLLSFGNIVNDLYNTQSYPGPDSLLNIISRIRSTASSTNINGAIQEAYERCEKNAVKGSVNHVLLITDGEFELNRFTKELVKEKMNIRLTCVIVGKGAEAERAVRYITDELQLKVIALVDEEKDVGKLTEIIQYQ